MNAFLQSFKIIALRLTLSILVFYLLVCAFLYHYQESIIFFPVKTAPDYHYQFAQDFKEIKVKSTDGKLIHGILFKAINPKGVIFYLHGNAGSLATWGNSADVYTQLGYDVFMIDYRGFGKSEGNISNQQQLFDDNQCAYDFVKRLYQEKEIIILGYSIGTGMAAKLSSSNNPSLLILQAPYYSLIDMMRNLYPFAPTLLLKYQFTTSDYLKQCKMPVVIFHGDDDQVIPYSHSLKLETQFKPQDTLIVIKNQDHNGITQNTDYNSALVKILNKHYN